MMSEEIPGGVATGSWQDAETSHKGAKALLNYAAQDAQVTESYGVITIAEAFSNCSRGCTVFGRGYNGCFIKRG